MFNHQDHLLIVIYHHNWLLITIIMFLMDYHYDWFSLYIYIYVRIIYMVIIIIIIFWWDIYTHGFYSSIYIPSDPTHGPHGQNPMEPTPSGRWPAPPPPWGSNCARWWRWAPQIFWSPLIKNCMFFQGKNYEKTKIGLKPSKKTCRCLPTDWFYQMRGTKMRILQADS